LDAIALPIEMGCRRRGDRSFVSIIQLLDGAGWGCEVGDRVRDKNSSNVPVERLQLALTTPPNISRQSAQIGLLGCFIKIFSVIQS